MNWIAFFGCWGRRCAAPGSGCSRRGGELAVALLAASRTGAAGQRFDELHVDLHPVAGELVLVALPTAVMTLVALRGGQPVHVKPLEDPPHPRPGSPQRRGSGPVHRALRRPESEDDVLGESICRGLVVGVDEGVERLLDVVGVEDRGQDGDTGSIPVGSARRLPWSAAVRGSARGPDPSRTARVHALPIRDVRCAAPVPA
jgi:hypothetical protein